MSHRTSAEVIADSITPYGDATRLTSMYVIFPKMILSERNRHRSFSLSDRSSRAVPPEKLIEEVREDPVMPAKFRLRTKGMGGGEELSGEELLAAEQTWRNIARRSANHAEALNKCGLAKEIVNRPLDPFIRMHSLMTATRDGWLNFFGLRLDPGADPTIQALAYICYEAYRASTPRLLQSSEWHLPFVDTDTVNAVSGFVLDEEERDQKQFDQRSFDEHCNEIERKVSAARCAHLSYNDLETGKRMTVERALAIYDKLTNSRPLHASPMEHQAQVDKRGGFTDETKRYRLHDWCLHHPEQAGNFCLGWRQFRKMLPNEAVAPFPKGYSL